MGTPTFAAHTTALPLQEAEPVWSGLAPGGALDISDCPVPAWLPGAHSQTLYASLFAPRRHMHFVRERVNTPDSDFIDIDWAGPGLYPSKSATFDAALLPQTPDAPALVLFHGLEGSSRSTYAQAIASHFRARGWVVAVPHFRGCSGAPNRLARAYHSGDSADVAFMLNTVRLRLPQARWHAVGVSLGGNALLKTLGEQGAAASWLAACAGVSAPLDLALSGNALCQGLLNRHLYTRVFLRTMKRKVLEKARRFPGAIDVLRITQARDLRDFDNAYTAPMHGFRNALDYWTRASCKPWLARIAVPTLVLNAKNDPFLPARALPGPADCSSQVLLHQPARGGHVGFPSGGFPGHLDWLPRRLARFFTAGPLPR